MAQGLLGFGDALGEAEDEVPLSICSGISIRSFSRVILITDHLSFVEASFFVYPFARPTTASGSFAASSPDFVERQPQVPATPLGGTPRSYPPSARQTRGSTSLCHCFEPGQKLDQAGEQRDQAGSSRPPRRSWTST